MKITARTTNTTQWEEQKHNYGQNRMPHAVRSMGCIESEKARESKRERATARERARESSRERAREEITYLFTQEYQKSGSLHCGVAAYESASQ